MALPVRLVALCVGVVICCLGLSMYQMPDEGVAPYDSLSLIMTEKWPRVPYFWHRMSNDVLGLTGSDQPCLCLCFGFSQITMTLPLRLMTLHFSHMGLTLGLTFIVVNLLLASPGDAAARQIVRRHLNRNLVTGEDSDKVHPELAGNMRQNGVSTANIDREHGIRQCIGYDALKFDYVVFCQDQLTPLVLTVEFLAEYSQFPS